ncbi:MAG: NAD(P)/FAD-dependent oxidoreductase [Ferruginibacter sp.]|nr:NAD(P)/FAD-dependent oxidoreductase [Ferruginibacter sp.]MBU9935689.1 NAD(P)/FAD-dependent oxidoreductase [Ferruginibacter sp.]
MQQKISLKLLPSEAADDISIKRSIAGHTGKKPAEVSGYHILKQSIDARAKTIWINLTVNAFLDEPFIKRTILPFAFKDVSKAMKKVVIIGAGPAGLFAAFQLLEQGIKPVILERGKDVRERRRDLARLNKEGIVNPESNYCFGEGGAGTYSDGKLYTRSTKRGDIDRVLNLFVRFGASEEILYQAHPHIGTNKLPHIITAMREQLTGCGAEVHFEKKVVDLIIANDSIKSVKTADGDLFEADAFILATGHSARDIFELLHRKQILIEAKPFALGVRIEHPQQLIDSIQYHCPARDENLPPSSYSLVQQVNNRGVFSFCMCPGGIIAPASTSPGELVVNGWSPSKRNNPFANSGMVVQVELEDLIKNEKLKTCLPAGKVKNDALSMMHFQQMVEQKCFETGGGNLVAPAQRMVDFSNGKTSSSLPGCSYHPGLNAVNLKDVLPGFIYQSLAKGFMEFGKKMKGYFTNDAVVVATESRTSSPVRIPRCNETLAHPQLSNFYPCGEGAGYAGGIVSAAMDGERVAKQLVKTIVLIALPFVKSLPAIIYSSLHLTC